MRPRTSKALAILGGVATLALGSTFMFRLATPKVKAPYSPCLPRLLELERAVCEPPHVVARSADLARTN